MKPTLIGQIHTAEAAIQAAAALSVVDIPATLSHALNLLHNVLVAAQDCPSRDRPAALAALKDLKTKISIFSMAMERSAAIFRGYTHRAGVSLDEYGPGGFALSRRDPAFFNLTV